MRSTFSGLNTVVRGIYAQQLSLDTTGHNVANASTTGFSRQRVNLSTSSPEVVYGGTGALQVGTGVAIQSVIRARDFFIDRQYWKENSSLGYATTSQTTWGKIEAVFNDDTTTGVGMQTVLNNFWQSWQTLVSNASNDAARTAVRQRGDELVDAIQHARQQLDNLVSDTNAAITTDVDKINQISSGIYSLNKQIANIEAGGRDNANDLRDQRDLLVDQLSGMMNVRIYEDSDRTISVAVGDVVLADGGGYTKLATKSAPDSQYGFEVRKVIVAGSNPPQYIKFGGGEMQALQEANSTLPQKYLDDLATMSKYLLTEFNDVHRGGYGSDNSTCNNFYGDAGTHYIATTFATNGEWLDAMKVNPDLYNANGLAKIAAKTAEIKSVIQSNANGGKATISGTYNSAAVPAFPAPYNVASPSTYKNFQITLTETGIEYTVTDEKGNSLSGPTPIAVAGSGTFALAYGLSINIAASAANASGDTYSFSVPQGNASGDNATNLANAIKQPTNSSSLLAGSSLDNYYDSMVADLGIRSQNQTSLAKNQQTMIDQITNWRESVAGVNLDEEMTNMIRFQKGYNAAARMVTSMDEMLDKLINGTGVAGR